MVKQSVTLWKRRSGKQQSLCITHKICGMKHTGYVFGKGGRREEGMVKQSVIMWNIRIERQLYMYPL